VARILADELGWTEIQAAEMTEAFHQLAEGFR
jgi:hypothetical protein